MDLPLRHQVSEGIVQDLGVAIEIRDHITWAAAEETDSVSGENANTIKLPVGDDGYHLLVIILRLIYYMLYIYIYIYTY